MTEAFYSDRARGPRARDLEEVHADAWRGLVALVAQRVDGNWLAQEFPEGCADGNGVVGTNRRNLIDLLGSLVPEIAWPPDRDTAPSTAEALDLVDFIAQRVAKPSQKVWHDYFRHHELEFDVVAGRRLFREDVNLIFGRSALSFELGPDMHVVRLGPPEARRTLSDLQPNTGDTDLDGMIIDARRRYLSRQPGDERVGLEKLWDAFERLKTIEPGRDKKTQVTALLDGCATGIVRRLLETEAKALTEIGNVTQIRHFETDKAPLTDDEVDYLFTRMSGLMVHLLRQTGRLIS